MSDTPKRGPGRPAIGRRVVVNLEEQHIRRAKQLGRGKIAEGVRIALTRR